jgi:hypothetical protein
MSKTEKFSAKQVAAMCDMTAKNFRATLRKHALVANHKRAERYAFTKSQANKLVAKLAVDEQADISAELAEAAE